MSNSYLVALKEVRIVADLPFREGRQERPLAVPVFPDQTPISGSQPARLDTLWASRVEAGGAVFELFKRAFVEEMVKRSTNGEDSGVEDVIGERGGGNLQRRSWSHE